MLSVLAIKEGIVTFRPYVLRGFGDVMRNYVTWLKHADLLYGFSTGLAYMGLVRV
jgi:hypothetical protein